MRVLFVQKKKLIKNTNNKIRVSTFYLLSIIQNVRNRPLHVVILYKLFIHWIYRKCAILWCVSLSGYEITYIGIWDFGHIAQPYCEAFIWAAIWCAVNPNELILCSRGNSGSSFPVAILTRPSFIIALDGFCDCTWRNFKQKVIEMFRIDWPSCLKVMMDCPIKCGLN